MIHALRIKNFQSHKQTHIEFAEGVNIIAGASDQGKSAILRALLWNVRNRPLGTDDIVSHWARDKKGKIAEEMSAEIIGDEGTVKRKRTADANEYILNTGEDIKGEKVFAAVKGDVPDDVLKFLKIGDVNFSQQHDAPFLLSASPSDTAKYFNKIVRLDVIDAVLGNAESARRETNKKIKETENEKKALEKELENFNWVETAQALMDKLSKVDERIKTYTSDFDSISDEIERYKAAKEELKDSPNTKAANKLIEKIESIEIDYEAASSLERDIEKYREVNQDRKIYKMIESGKDMLSKIDGCDAIIISHEADIFNIQGEIEEYTENKKISDLGFDKKQAVKLIAEIESIRPDYDAFRELHYQIEEYNRMQLADTEAAKEIDDLKTQLPDNCPECGHSLVEVE